MYLLLNNNKYLDQIIKCLFYCLKKNNIDSKIIYELPKKEIEEHKDEEVIEEPPKVSSLLKNVPISTEYRSDLLKNVPISNNKSKNDIFDNFKAKTGNMEDLLKIANNMGDILPKNVNLRSIAHNKNDLKVENEDIINEQKKIKNSDVEDNSTYIIFNINKIEEEDLPKNYIVYNFEQLTTDRKWNESFFEKCRKAKKVLDYSLENIKQFDLRNISAHHLPFGWCSILEPDYSLDDKDIDLLFLGSLNNNRISTITEINRKNLGKNFYLHNKCFDDDFEKVVSKSKIGLNIHYYNGKTILELTRIIPFICAGIHVISERSNDLYYDKIFNGIITFCRKEDMADMVNKAISEYELSYALKKRKKLKKKLNFENIIKENIFLFKI